MELGTTGRPIDKGTIRVIVTVEVPEACVAAPITDRNGTIDGGSLAAIGYETEKPGHRRHM